MLSRPGKGEHHDSFLTLLLSLLTLSLVYLYRNHTAKKLLILFCSAAVSFFILTNFRFAGVLLIAAFWFYLERMDQWSYVKRLLCLLLIITVYIPVYTWARADFGGCGAFSELFVASLPWYAVHYLMMFVLASYNGRQGTRSRTFQAIYSWFYPAHLIVLAIARFFAG